MKNFDKLAISSNRRPWICAWIRTDSKPKYEHQAFEGCTKELPGELINSGEHPELFAVSFKWLHS